MEATKVAMAHHIAPLQVNAQVLAQNVICSPKRKDQLKSQLPSQPEPTPGPAPRPQAQDASPKSSPRRKPRGGRVPTDRPGVVHVTGFPQYTQSHDVEQVFSTMGPVRVEMITNKIAALHYADPENAKSALQHSRKISVFGDIVTVTADVPQHNADRKSNIAKKNMFERSRKKGIILDPQNIDLSGDFHQQLDRVLTAVRLSQEEVTRLHALYTDLESVLKEQWPECKAVPFGSITTGLGIKSSDADCFVEVGSVVRGGNGGSCVQRAKRLLQTRPQLFAEILPIPRANTPIVKFFHIPTDTSCDVTFKTPLGAQNSKLIAFLLHADPRLIPLAVVVKYWAKVHGFSGSCKLTNYALTLMVIFYLQQPPITILPSVEWLQRDASDDFIVDYWNTGFACQYNTLPRSSNTSSISELLGGFFEFYAMFNFDEMVICPYLGCPIKKDAFRDVNLLPVEFSRYKHNTTNRLVPPFKWTTSICIQDPFEQSHNVSSSISSRLAAEIRTYFKFAANLYEKEKLNECAEFLNKLLTTKPKIIRGRTHPEYRVNLFPRIVVNIIDPDWKSVVREVVLTIFEKMLKLKMGKVEEKVNPDSRKEKEKYMSVVTRAIWRRKQFSRLYNMMNLDFKQKEERITDEILTVDKEVLNIPFQLTITYCHEPKSAVVSIKMSNGDVDAFKDFGKFYISVMQDWFMTLMKPYSRPVENNTAAKIAETIRSKDSPADAAGDSDESLARSH